MPYQQFQFPPQSLFCLETNRPAQASVDLGTIITPVLCYDDTTEEYGNGVLEVPDTLDTAGTVTFRVVCSPKTGAASKNVGWTFGHRPVNTAEAIDGSYTDEDSGAIAITATTGQQTIMEWTETVANLGWVAGDVVYFRLSRDPGVTNDLTGDCYFVRLAVDVPVTT